MHDLSVVMYFNIWISAFFANLQKWILAGEIIGGLHLCATVLANSVTWPNSPTVTVRFLAVRFFAPVRVRSVVPVEFLAAAYTNPWRIRVFEISGTVHASFSLI